MTGEKWRWVRFGVRRGWRVAVTLGLLTLCACQRASSAPPIIMILVDTLRADYLGAYGFEGEISPNIDAFAEEAVLFDNCFSQAPWTKPSIASLFTSLQPPVHRVYSHGGKFGARGDAERTETLSDEAVTLAEALKAGGYATAAFVANPWIRQKHGFGQGFDVFDSHASGNGVVAEPILAAARKWMAGVPAGQPYFAYVHLMDVHGPYDAPDEDYDAVRDSPEFGSEPEPLTRSQIGRVPSYLRRSPWVRGAVDLRLWRARYAANVHALDRRLGPFFEELREAGVLDAALVVITADHGEQLYEHGGWDHGNSLYDEELHVPLIIRLPRGGNQGHRVDAVVSLVDVMPTLIGFARAPGVDGLQGRDLSGSIGAESRSLASVASFATAVKWKPELRSLRTERYKLIKKGESSRRQLYDLRSDPGELVNIAEVSPAYAAVNELLTEQMARNSTRGELHGAPAPLPARVRERLRALGYYEDLPTPTP